MSIINELTNILKPHLSWNKARISCLAQLIQAIFLVRTVNLSEISVAFKIKAKPESSYKRIQRFLKDFHFDLSCIVPLIKHLFALSGSKVTLIMDRTNWKFGKAKINILVLAIAYEKIAIPFFWLVLNRSGNSKTQHRIKLLKHAIETFGREKIRVILADREFVGTEWFQFLLNEKLPFCIRIQKKFMINGARKGCAIPVKEMFKNIKPFKKKILKDQYNLWGVPVYLSAGRFDHQDLIILASSIPLNEPIELYKKRWEIETLFGCLKKRGFRMEETHLSRPERIEKLFFVLVIAFCWAYKLGHIKRLTEPIKIKNHSRLLFSFFRYGFDEIRKVFFNIEGYLKKFKSILKVIKNQGIVAYE